MVSTMKMLATVLLAGLMAIPLAPGACAVARASQQASPRAVTPLDFGWRFERADVKGAEVAGFNDSKWQAVSLPHTYDAAAGDTGEDFYRGPAWYRRSLFFKKVEPATRTFIEFDGASLTTEVWLNGRAIGRHDGGFARFRFDLTSYLVPGKNVLAVRIDNSKNPDIAPLSGDFAIFGGLYRRVRLVTTREVHFDMLDYGSSGIQLRTPTVDSTYAVVKADLRLTNDTADAADTDVTATIYDAGHNPVAVKTTTVRLAAGTTTPVTFEINVLNPRLWNGVNDPYLYEAAFTLTKAGNETLDSSAIPLGIRTIQISPEKGLFLNGRPYSVHGVAIHQTMRPGHGPAVGEEAVRRDFVMLREMGATGLRLAHYQHAPIDYELADRMGFLVWTEIPFVGEATNSEAFCANLVQQTRELIRQNVNHPSVMVWGIGNEVKDAPEVYQALEVAKKTAHVEDPSRPTTYAACCGPADHPRTKYSDVIAYNQYLGWYRGEIGDWSHWLDDFHQANGHTPMAISEFGAGASVLHQEDPVHRPVANKSHWHPEQWQALVHEGAWRAIAEKPYLWASFIWNGFDFPSIGRDEGDHRGRNDKGLITFDRKIKKDAYSWYQANWTDKPMVYITSRRFVRRATSDVEVKIYSNQPAATLTLNGLSLGSRTVTDHIAIWHARLRKGQNKISVTAGPVVDLVAWTYQPSSFPPPPPPGAVPAPDEKP
jgi:beta-galactosidase